MNRPVPAGKVAGALSYIQFVRLLAPIGTNDPRETTNPVLELCCDVTAAVSRFVDPVDLRRVWLLDRFPTIYLAELERRRPSMLLHFSREDEALAYALLEGRCPPGWLTGAAYETDSGDIDVSLWVGSYSGQCEGFRLDLLMLEDQ